MHSWCRSPIWAAGIVLLLFGALVYWEHRHGTDRPATRQSPAVSERDALHVDDERSLTSVLGALPGGEWWGQSAKFVAVLEIDQVEGLAAIATETETRVLRVTISLPGVDRIEYELTDNEFVSTWLARIAKAEIATGKIGSEEDLLDELIVERVYGGYAPVGDAFPLFRSDRRDPLRVSGVGIATTVQQLRERIRERRGS